MVTHISWNDVQSARMIVQGSFRTNAQRLDDRTLHCDSAEDEAGRDSISVSGQGRIDDTIANQLYQKGVSHVRTSGMKVRMPISMKSTYSTKWRKLLFPTQLLIHGQ